MTNTKIIRAAFIALIMGAVSACSTNQVADNTGSATGFVAKTAVKGAVGAGKLVYRGGKYVVVGSEGS